ncbi:MYND-type domain-containing protein [Mycena kentingensis (nom. inval.)]|nr:MYND-type domain-containing protein [Mycena kentingensis (nom. inval.)]
MSATECNNCKKTDGADQFKRCSRCKQASYCSTDCQAANWPSHKATCRPSQVRGITIACEGDMRRNGGLFKEIDIDAAHPIHSQGVVCPMSAKVGLPIVIYRHLRENPLTMTRTPNLDNQRATYLMINPVDGFAPPEWQMCVGTVTVMRRDGKPLTRESIETIWMYHDHLLDLFGDGAPPYRQMTNEKFRAYCENYKEDMILNGRNEFATMVLPL